MSGECQVNVNSQSELDIGGRETCIYLISLKVSANNLTYIWNFPCSFKTGFSLADKETRLHGIGTTVMYDGCVLCISPSSEKPVHQCQSGE